MRRVPAQGMCLSMSRQDQVFAQVRDWHAGVRLVPDVLLRGIDEVKEGSAARAAAGRHPSRLVDGTR